MSQQEAQAELAAAVQDLRAEGDELYALMKDSDTGFWTQTSSFKNWTVWDVIAHLHYSDNMALTSVSGPEAFKTMVKGMSRSKSMRQATSEWLTEDGHSITGPDLLERWRNMFLTLCDALQNADPGERFSWFGPGMKARMFATARQMETWAHGWEIYDLMGQPRQHQDRIKNIVTIGVRTYGWTFTNRQLEIPEPQPYVELTAPSGATWTFNDASSPHSVKGEAVEFCQVVTQVRHVADTGLQVSGDNARAWMEIAQCFAGGPEDPPAPGSRVPQT
ncbi:MAG: TIGR03084 family metal-binding protein [Pseudomonadota bacterium]